MKQAKRRVWSILLACVMLLTMLPAGAWLRMKTSRKSFLQVLKAVRRILTCKRHLMLRIQEILLSF